MSARASHPFVASSFAALFLACSSSSTPASAPSDSGGFDAATDAHDPGDAPTTASLVELPCTDAIADVYAAPTSLTAAKGTILKCALDQHLTASAFEARAKTNGYVGPAFTSGAYLYRVQYVTQRGDTANSAGFSTALVYIPDTPIAPSLPLLTAAHGTVGQGKTCLVSQNGALAGGDALAEVEPFAGAGYPIIMSDYAGYAQFGATGNPPSGYLIPNDAPKSLLDAVHALRTMIPSHASQQVVITGHSQGGHVALSALAMAATYGVDGTLAGVVGYSPVWFTDLSWGGLLLLAGADPYKLVDYDFVAATAAWYFYSRAELTDGPGHGVDVFAASAKSSVKSFFENACLDSKGVSALDALGTYIDDLFDPDFISGVGAPAATGGDCATDGSKGAALCKTWLPRMKADRPHLTGTAKSVPILWVYGGNDTTIPPDRSTCGVDRLNADGAKVKTCVFPGVSHGDILRNGAAYAIEWVSMLTRGTADPGACPSSFSIASDGTSSFVPSDGSAPISCNALPPNNDDG